ncbi:MULTISPECIES: type II toxin-antitoxin system Phd/YefM family antitoxin [unclassified Meiothermus]|uniref:type II toxin-antitoxin system Phd/YefM family antitoxin n=1 Tax=unclassified Meiothermus TaxID=370471 RepID=UPI000D7C9344|nr:MULTISPECIES: type II toxin-antitoxin system Phd/YefM family antitoxin [unclassified Meiothermus]PZA05986.1 prevent-host-death protein [Meiothermus sp. Pnk-1]RYM35265.1 type II toxin-antitoxin system Phd/YefM family antitoxin [Meiothermus sp. PNK-Is4]
MKRTWQLQEAKARFSEVVERALKGEPQTVTRRGRPAVVVLDWATYTRLRGKDVSLLEALRPSEPLSDEEAEALANRPQTGYREVGF